MRDGSEGGTTNTTPKENNHAKHPRSNIKRVRRSPARVMINTGTEIKPTLINDPDSIKTIEFKGEDFLQANTALASPNYAGVLPHINQRFKHVGKEDVKKFWSKYFKAMTPSRKKQEMLDDLADLVIQVHKSKKNV